MLKNVIQIELIPNYMRSYFIRLLFIFPFFLLGFNQLRASHAAGAEITYKCISGNTFELTYNFYRDCGGINAPSLAALNSTSGGNRTYITSACGGNISPSWVGHDTVDVTPVCDGVNSECNGGTIPGIALYVYKDTVVLSPACNFWTVGVQINARNTSNNIKGGNLVVEATIFNTNRACNNSPTFSSPPAPYFCVGQPVNYSYGATDSDGDSLVFRFTDPKGVTATGTPATTWRPGYNIFFPIPGITINVNNGDLSFTSAISGTFTIPMVVTEYERGTGILLGTIMRDIQIASTTIGCSGNAVPALSAIGITNINYGTRVDSVSVKTKKGSSLCFEIPFTDADATDSLITSTNASSALPGTVTTTQIGVTNQVNRQVCWTVPSNASGTYNLTVDVRDNNCPINATSALSARVIIEGDLNFADITYVKETCDGQGDGKLTAIHTGGIGPFSYRWDSAGVPISDTTKTITDVPTGVVYGVYVVDLFDMDSLYGGTENLPATLPVYISGATSVTPVGCEGGNTGSITLGSVTGGSVGTGGYKYIWSPSGATVKNPTNLSAGQHMVTISDDNGCDSSFVYTVSRSPSVSVSVFDDSTKMVSCKGGDDGEARARATTTACGTYGTSSAKCSSTTIASIGLATGATPSNGFPTPFGSASGGRQQYLYLASELYAAGFQKGRISSITFPYQFGFNINYKDIQFAIGCTDSTNLDSGFVNAGFPVFSAANHQLNTTDLGAGFSRISFNTEFVWDGNSNIVLTICNSKVSGGSMTFKKTTTSFNSVAYFTSDTSNACLSDTATVISKERPDISFEYCDQGISYSWNSNPIQTDSIASNLVANTYIVTATNLVGCDAKDTVIITEPALGIVLDTTIIQPLVCNGDTNGSVSVEVTGGTPVYNFSWFNVAGVITSPDSIATNLRGNTLYKVAVSDGNHCKDTIDVGLIEPSPITFAANNQVNVSCFGDSTGIARVVANGGSGVYTSYAWNPVAISTVDTAKNLWAGDFFVTVTDNQGCTGDTLFTITQPSDSITLGASVVTPVTCGGDSTGSITLNPSGGSGNYTNFVWSPNVSSTSSANLLWAGDFNVTFNDDKGCTKDTTFTIVELNSEIRFTNNVVTPVTCAGDSTGSITLNTIGGSGVYTAYTWNPNVGNTSNVIDLWAGNFSVTVTDNAGCTGDTTFTINETLPPLFFTGTTADSVACFGENTGKIKIKANGGSGTYTTYVWDPITASTVDSAINLVAGPYSVTVTDNAGCTGDTTITIGQPADSISFPGNNQTNILCFGDSTGVARVLAIGGSGVYTSYSWTPSTVSSVDTAINLWAGDFRVTVTDSKGCTGDTLFTITEPSDSITFNLSTQINIACEGDSTGKIFVVPSGGSGTYTSYVWDPVAISAVDSAVNLWAGNFSVTVTDDDGCTGDTTFTITEPSNGITFASSTVLPIACQGDSTGKIFVVPTGGSGTYTSYVWDPISISTVDSAVNLWQGNYSVTVTDNVGCSNDTTFTINQPANLLRASFINRNPPSCTGGGNDGEIHVLATNGNRPYTYDWGTTSGTSTNANDSTRTGMSAGFVNVTVTDFTGCTVELKDTFLTPGGLTVTFTDTILPKCFGDTNGRLIATHTGGTGAVTYTWTATQGRLGSNDSIWIDAKSELIEVEVEDALGCTFKANINLAQPDSLQFSPVIDPVACKGDSTGKIVLFVSGGNSGYSYQWSPAGLGVADSAIDLWTGNFLVTVTDDSSCTKDTTIFISEPANALTANIVKSALDCFTDTNATVSVTPTGGSGNYSYNWDSGTAGTSDSLRIDLRSGEFNVTVTDLAGGCSIEITDTILAPDSLYGTFTQTNQPGCGTTGLGSITVTPTGGTPGYTYTWIGGGINGATDSVRINVPSGLIQAVIIDSKGCSSDTVSQNLGGVGVVVPVWSLIEAPKCTDDTNGQLIVTPTGGNAPYTFAWNEGNTGVSDSNRIDLPSGVEIQCVVTDKDGCFDTAKITFTNPIPVTLTFTDSVSPLCAGDTNGSITVTPLGGTKPYNFNWSNSDTDSIGNNLGGGIFHIVTVTDDKGCEKVDSSRISDPLPLSAQFADSTSVTCFGGNDGALRVVPINGVPIYNYSWSASDGSTVQRSAIGDSIAVDLFGDITYTVTVSDGNSCEAIISKSLDDPTQIRAIIFSNAGPCDTNAGVIRVPAPFVQGGTGPYTITYDSNGTALGTGNILTDLWPGVYGVTIEDSKGCTRVYTEQVENRFAPRIFLDSLNDATCEGVCDGDIYIRVQSFNNIPVTYLWSNSDTTQDIENQCASPYSVTVTDTNGCVRIGEVEIGFEDTLLVDLSATPLSCNSLAAICDATVSSSSPNGVSPYSYKWSTSVNDTLLNITNLCAGKYLHTITDSRGCIAQDSATIDPSATFTVTTSMDSASCFGGTDGVARVASVSGGSTPYSYQWSTPGNDTNSVNSGLSAGTYYVTVSGSGSCSIIDTVEVLQPLGMSFTYTSVLANCNQADGVVIGSLTGGKAPYTYNWPVGGVKISNVDSFYSANAYQVIVTDDENCNSTFSFNISNSGGAVVTLDSIKHETCVGSCNGGIYVSVTGGTPNYFYNWAPGGSKSKDTVNACPGEYDLQVIDQNNCITLFTDTIEAASPIISNIVVSNHATAVGTCDGIAKVAPTGGAGGYLYSWASGSVSDTANSLCAGFAVVTITDSKGCFIVDSIEITEPNILTLDSAKTTDATCNAVPCDGTATVFISGGSGSYTYLWDNGDFGPTTTVRCAGTSTVVVSDGSISASFSVRIFETNSSVVQATLVQDVSCNGGSDGKAYASLISGQPITSWSWSPAGGISDTASGVSAAFYTVSATNSLGCTSSDTITINEPSAIITSYDTISSSCGVADGFIIAQVSGGSPGYSITWLDASKNPLLPSQTGDTAKNLASGVYHYEVIDSKGCSRIVQTILNDKNAPIVTLDSLNDVSCYGVCDGDIYISAIGGTGTLSYNWMPGSISTPDLTNSCADEYTLQVSDASGCKTTFVDTIKTADSLDITLTKLNDISAVGLCDGSASASVTGGQPIYSFKWTGGGANSISNTLCEGINYVTVTDSKGCFGVDSIEILKPAGIILTQVDTTMPACGVCDGKIKITPSGGLAPYTYLWDNGDTTDSTINRCASLVFVTVTDATGSLQGIFSIGLNNINGPSIQVNTSDVSCNSLCDGSAVAIASSGTAPYTYRWPSMGKTDSNIVNLCKGIYQVEVRDALGCISTDSAEIKEPSAITASLNTTIADCGLSNGSASITLAGGVTPYKYTWLPLGTVTTVPSITGIPAGAYSVVIEDSTLCSETIPFGIDNPTGPSITIDTSLNESCDGACNGSIFITASGTPGPYSYKWLPGGAISEDISNLCAGVYTVEVTDGNKCVTVAMDTIEGPSTPIRTLTVVSHVNSFGKCEGKAFVQVAGGNTGYRFQWSSSEVGDTAKALCAGVNYITITNPDGCQFFDSLVIREPQPLIISTKSIIEPSCNVCDGKITVNVVGGTPPYNFVWDNGDAADSTTKRCAGTAFLTVTDANNYSALFQLALSNTTAPTVSITTVNDKCANTCDGMAIALGSGTLAPYSYNWPTVGVRSDTAKGLCSGTYEVEVTDKVGCVKVETITIKAPPAIDINFAVTSPKCKEANGKVFANVSGGLPKSAGYEYLWLDNKGIGIVPAQTSDSLSNVTANLYYLTVSDSNNCMDTAAVNLNNVGGVAITLDSIKNASCVNSCDGEILVSTTGLFNTYKWLPSEETTKKITGLCLGEYNVQVTDTGGCITTSSYTITAPVKFNVISSKVLDATCVNTNDGLINTFISEPGNYNYSWTGTGNFSATSNNITNLLAGDYQLVVTDENGCTDSLSESVAARIYFDIIGKKDSAYCGEQTIPLAISVVGSGFHSTVWYDANGFILGRTDTIAWFHSKGVNQYTSEVRQEQCVAYDTVLVTIEEDYIIDAGKDRTIIKGQKTTLGGVPTISNGNAVLWSPDENLSSVGSENPIATPIETTTYIVSSGLEGGCLNRDTVVVKVEDRISVNNAISPNGDGVNDTWEIGILNDYPNASVKILNRWGQTIYDVYPYIPWDGTYEGEQLQLGTYYYIIDLKDSEIENPILTGPITIIR